MSTSTTNSDITANTHYKNRTDEVVSALVAAVREVIKAKHVRYAEFQAALDLLNRFNGAAPYEINMVCDLFFEQTVLDQEQTHLKSSRVILEGPFFLEGAPEVTDELKTVPGEGEPFKLRTTIKDIQGHPLEGAVVDVWHCSPEGNYSGFFDELPIDYFRGKVTTDADGKFTLKTTKPKEYPVPSDGPTGQILAAMDRSIWRPAHIHLMCRKPGYKTHITQAYFEGHAFIDDDPADGVRPEVIYPIKREGSYQAIDVEIVMQRDDE
jgi:chlorocatechol 1,2-dioxygenase